MWIDTEDIVNSRVEQKVRNWMPIVLGAIAITGAIWTSAATIQAQQEKIEALTNRFDRYEHRNEQRMIRIEDMYAEMLKEMRSK